MRPRRLRNYSYSGPQRYFLTICTFERRRYFTNPLLVTQVHDQFLRTAARFEFAILAYCYMPDHLHLLVEGLAERSDLCALVARSKQLTGFWSASHIRGRLWQQGYFERVLRDDDDTFNVARYVIQNPVRAGLVQSPGDYPFIGSSILTKEQLIGSCAWNPRERRKH